MAIDRGVALSLAVASFGCQEARLLFIGFTDIGGSCQTVVTDKHLEPPFAGAKPPDLQMKKKLKTNEVLVWEIVSNCAQPHEVKVTAPSSNPLRMIVDTGFSFTDPMILSKGTSVVGVFSRSAPGAGRFLFKANPKAGTSSPETPQLQIEVVP